DGFDPVDLDHARWVREQNPVAPGIDPPSPPGHERLRVERTELVESLRWIRPLEVVQAHGHRRRCTACDQQPRLTYVSMQDTTSALGGDHRHVATAAPPEDRAVFTAHQQPVVPDGERP